jgi:hypothetical protein
MRTRLRGKVTLLFTMLGLVLAIAGVAIADTLKVNDLVTGGNVSVTKPSTQATQGQAQIYLVAFRPIWIAQRARAAPI